MEIKIDKLDGKEIVALLNEHLDDMYATSPPESVHALDLVALKNPDYVLVGMGQRRTSWLCSLKTT